MCTIKATAAELVICAIGTNCINICKININWRAYLVTFKNNHVV